MKKSAIIAAAIASLVAGSATADSTVYGAAHASVVSVDNTTTGVKNMQVQTNVSKNWFTKVQKIWVTHEGCLADGNGI